MGGYFSLFGRPLFAQAKFDRAGWWHTLPNGNTHHHWLTIGRRSHPDAPDVTMLILIVGPALFRFGCGQQPAPSIKETT